MKYINGTHEIKHYLIIFNSHSAKEKEIENLKYS
jgi:hypothetical protein